MSNATSERLDFWTQKQEEIHARLKAEKVEDFLGWATVLTTMFVGEAPYIKFERAALQADDEERWERAIGEEWGGQPNTNLLHQAYHLMQWERTTGKRVSDLASVVEVGPGYGALARVLFGAGFQGEYAIIDLPELGTIQRFYLGQYGIKARWPKKNESVTTDLLISLWGISEISEFQRATILQRIQYRHCLLAYQDMWGDFSNEIFFSRLVPNAIFTDIAHLPGNQYAIG